ncbi:unnamed protein product [Urochloa humidicola]
MSPPRAAPGRSQLVVRGWRGKAHSAGHGATPPTPRPMVWGAARIEALQADDKAFSMSGEGKTAAPSRSIMTGPSGEADWPPIDAMGRESSSRRRRLPPVASMRDDDSSTLLSAASARTRLDIIFFLANFVDGQAIPARVPLLCLSRNAKLLPIPYIQFEACYAGDGVSDLDQEQRRKGFS